MGLCLRWYTPDQTKSEYPEDITDRLLIIWGICSAELSVFSPHLVFLEHAEDIFHVS